MTIERAIKLISEHGHETRVAGALLVIADCGGHVTTLHIRGGMVSRRLLLEQLGY